jgi:hypothetical protein
VLFSISFSAALQSVLAFITSAYIVSTSDTMLANFLALKSDSNFSADETKASKS